MKHWNHISDNGSFDRYQLNYGFEWDIETKKHCSKASAEVKIESIIFHPYQSKIYRQAQKGTDKIIKQRTHPTNCVSLQARKTEGNESNIARITSSHKLHTKTMRHIPVISTKTIHETDYSHAILETYLPNVSVK